MNSNKASQWSVRYITLLVILLAVSLLGAIYFVAYNFVDISTQLVLNILIPMFIIAAFLERTQEVFVASWRDIERGRLEQTVREIETGIAKCSGQATDGLIEKLKEANLEVSRFKTDTRRYVFLFGLASGILISIVGVRVLKPLTSMDASTVGFQRHLFNFTDIVLTGALIGGGSESIHRVVAVITDFLDATRTIASKKQQKAENG
ncbi:MAG TPA: hypothetical protein VN285_06570 [Candidatus Deferrimicrobium sp.]|nr:hypothetical protein [Candidatus Deferrimicrobium sp.]